KVSKQSSNVRNVSHVPSKDKLKHEIKSKMASTILAANDHHRRVQMFSKIANEWSTMDASQYPETHAFIEDILKRYLKL
ncbi:MAG: hypothetical protein ACTSUE_01975, partial [Promethearchaeota archaeon]